ncbi:MAG: response regulator, partial [Oscillospiraceae bacterium]
MFYIALCDDERKDLDILTEHLKDLPWNKYKYEAIPLQNGEDLVEMYRNGRRFHLVILDMMMKPMSGIETAVNIRRYDADVPIIIVTSTPEYALEGYKVSASRYILKPVDKSSFLQEVQRLLD